MKRECILLLTIALSVAIVQAQTSSDESTLTVSLGASYGIFSGNQMFANIYTDEIHPIGGFITLGDGSISIVGRYDKLQTYGSSVVKNLPIKGQAEWRQEFASLGLRFLQRGTRLYVEVSYVFMQGKESITTQPIQILELTGSTTIKDRGIGAACGWTPQILGPIGIFMEIKYIVLFQNSTTSTGEKVRDLGGLFVTAGISLSIP